MDELNLDGLRLGLFLAAAFFGGLTSGLSGFAMGLVVSGVWLHIITPEQNALLIVLCGLVTQGSGIWRVRHAINWRAVAPFIIGGALGVPAGTALVTTVDQSTLRLTMGFLLVIQSLQPDPACAQTGSRWCSGGRRRWRRERPHRRTDRTGRHCGDGLVSVARRSQGRATRHLSARDVCDLRHERDFLRCRRRIHCRSVQALWARASRSDCRSLVWPQALWKAR